MPWSGPTQDLSQGPIAIATFLAKQKQQEFENALELASRGPKGPMTVVPSANPLPGMSVANNPLLDPLRSLQDPEDQAEQAGHLQATAQDSADQTRYNAIQGIPGIDARTAARMVYGRSGVLDNPDPDAMHAALSNYIANPTRDTAAAAVRAGASLNQFPDRFLPVKSSPGGGELPERPAAPVPGTPEYFQMQQQLEDMRVAGVKSEIAARAGATAANDPFAAARRDAQQTRLALDEARRDSPRPSKVPDTVMGKDAQGRPAMIPNPAKAQALADSTAYDANTIKPLQRRFQAESGNAPAAAGGADPATALKTQANQAIQKILSLDISQDDKIARTAEVHRRLNAALLGTGSAGTHDNNDDEDDASAGGDTSAGAGDVLGAAFSAGYDPGGDDESDTGT